jgi:hypothetical protein
MVWCLLLKTTLIFPNMKDNLPHLLLKDVKGPYIHTLERCESTILIHLSVCVCVCVCDHWTQFVCDHWTHRLRDGKKEKWRWIQRKMTGKRWDDRRMRCVRLSESWNPGRETEVLKPKSWGPGPEIEVRRAAYGFFFRPFSADCPGLLPGFLIN